MGKVKKKFTPLQRYKVTIVVIKGLISQNPHLITFLTRNTAFKRSYFRLNQKVWLGRRYALKSC